MPLRLWKRLHTRVESSFEEKKHADFSFPFFVALPCQSTADNLRLCSSVLQFVMSVSFMPTITIFVINIITMIIIIIISNINKVFISFM